MDSIDEYNRKHKFVEIEGIKYFADDIEKMSLQQIKHLCMFLNEKELNFVKKYTPFEYIIENIIDKSYE